MTTYTYTTINVPGITITDVGGINDKGQIVGWYETAISFPYSAGGFLYSGGTCTTFNDPSGITVVGGINDKGQIVGTYPFPGGEDGFLYSGGTYTTISIPGSIETDALGINNKGQIVAALDSMLQLYLGFMLIAVAKFGFLADPHVHSVGALHVADAITLTGINISSLHASDFHFV
jgi:uncharacterized membrane protein